MPILYWYFPMIIFSGVCDLMSPDLGRLPLASAPTAYGSAHDDDIEAVCDEVGHTCHRPR
jgi:hypothetical protein